MRGFVAQFDRAMEVRQDAARRCRAVRHVWSDVDTAVWEPLVAIYCGRPDEATPLLEEYKPVAERVGHQTVLWFYKLSEAMAALTEGSLLSPSRRRATRSRSGSRALDRVALRGLSVPWAHQLLSGRSDDAIARLREAIGAEPPGIYFTGISAASLMYVLHTSATAAYAHCEITCRTCRSAATFRRKARGAPWPKSSRALCCSVGATRPRLFANRPKIWSRRASSGMPIRCSPRQRALRRPARASGRARRRTINVPSDTPTRRIAFASPTRVCGMQTCCSHAGWPATETAQECCSLKRCRSANRSACPTSHSSRARVWLRPAEPPLFLAALLFLAVVGRAGARRPDEQLLAVRECQLTAVALERAVLGPEPLDDELSACGSDFCVKPRR